MIFPTARGSEADRVMGLELGANDYMVKPFSIREFITRVNVQLHAAEERANAGLRFEMLLDRSRCRASYNGDPILLSDRNSGQISRQMKRLRVRGLIKKV